MSVWKSVMYRYNREELQKWTSFRKTAYLLVPLFIYFVVHDVSQILLWALIDVVLQKGNQNLQGFLAQNANTLQGIVNGLAIFLGTVSIGKALKMEIGFSDKEEAKEDHINAKKVGEYVILGVLAFLSAIGINILFDQFGITQSSESFQQVHDLQYGVQFAAGLILYGLVSPVAEEAVFRGLIYNRMKRCFSDRIAWVVSSLLFGCYHGNLVQAVYGIILGLLIAWLYERYESFAAPVLFHSVANISVYVMTYNRELNQISRQNALIMATIMLLSAMGIIIFIKKSVGKQGK